MKKGLKLLWVCIICAGLFTALYFLIDYFKKCFYEKKYGRCRPHYQNYYSSSCWCFILARYYRRYFSVHPISGCWSFPDNKLCQFLSFIHHCRIKYLQGKEIVLSKLMIFQAVMIFNCFFLFLCNSSYTFNVFCRVFL